MKTIAITALLLLTTFSFADVISGEITWSGRCYPESQLGDPPPPDTGIASFLFDTSTQTGILSDFYGNSSPLDGNYEFSVSSEVYSMAELTGSTQPQWIIYEEALIPDGSTNLLWSMRGNLEPDGTFWFSETDEIFHGVDMHGGTFSVVPEPSTVWLLALGGAVILRKQKRANQSTHSITGSAASE
ncbi:MAG: PEP-CTERM sorting domain-containing protein [Verrucomicrobia bacterium]|nr:PEP-CTERM sorting domain-containing protein [Verrucomicrobiota bacterium]